MTEKPKTFAPDLCPHPVVDGEVARTVKLANEAATTAFSAQVAKHVRAGDVLALWGNLGAGKSAFSRGLIRAVTTPDEEVPSPTFTLVQVYEPDNGDEIWHFDLYRIEDPEEIWELGFEDALECAVSLIEWPSRLGGYLPKRRLDVVIDFEPEAGDTARCVTLVARGATWGERLSKMELGGA